jgi:RimJ/RimL family protein N-acetyltransferase
MRLTAATHTCTCHPVTPIGHYRDGKGAAVIAWVELPQQVIEGDGIRLRPHRPADLDDLVEGCNDPLTSRFTPILPSPYTARDGMWWIGQGAAASFAAGGAAYVIADPATDRLIGGIGLTRTPGLGRRANIGYWVSPRARERGVATAATVALSGWAFEHGLHRLDLLTALENLASQRVAMAAGYAREGVLRGVMLGRDGAWEDRVVWARLAGDPPGPTRRLLPDLPGGALNGALSDGGVLLRPLRAADAPVIHALHLLPDVVACSVPPVAPDREEIELRCARAGTWWLAGERADLVITDAASGQVTGDIGLYNQEPRTGQAMIGYTMLPGWRGRGYATRAVRLLARWAFEQAGIERLIAGTHPANISSRRVLARAGFRREGYQHERLPGAAGTRLDDVLYALLPRDLPAPSRQAPVHTARLSTP